MSINMNSGSWAPSGPSRESAAWFLAAKCAQKAPPAGPSSEMLRVDLVSVDCIGLQEALQPRAGLLCGSWLVRAALSCGGPGLIELASERAVAARRGRGSVSDNFSCGSIFRVSDLRFAHLPYVFVPLP